MEAKGIRVLGGLAVFDASCGWWAETGALTSQRTPFGPRGFYWGVDLDLTVGAITWRAFGPDGLRLFQGRGFGVDCDPGVARETRFPPGYFISRLRREEPVATAPGTDIILKLGHYL